MAYMTLTREFEPKTYHFVQQCTNQYKCLNREHYMKIY